jgi:magnesium transporter
MPTAGELATRAVPRARPGERADAELERMRGERLDEAAHCYLVDGADRLLGQVPLERLLAAPRDALVEALLGAPPLVVRPGDDAEAAALLAVEAHDADVAVVEDGGRLVGAVPVARLLALLHAEHVAEILRRGGVGALHPEPDEAQDPLRMLRARVPWLLIGLGGGLAAGAVASLFEASLEREVTLAFFLPLVVYMADAIGTQTETILVRRLAYGPVSLAGQLAREGALGLLLGASLGGAAALALWLVGGRVEVALVVGGTIAATALVATLVASLLPWALARLGADPALASGPVATVVQDVLSVAIYFAIASSLL